MPERLRCNLYIAWQGMGLGVGPYCDVENVIDGSANCKHANQVKKKSVPDVTDECDRVGKVRAARNIIGSPFENSST